MPACPKCSRTIGAVDVFCGFCGARVTTVGFTSAAPAAPRNGTPTSAPPPPAAPPDDFSFTDNEADRQPPEGPADGRLGAGDGEPLSDEAQPASIPPPVAQPAGALARFGAALLDAAVLAAWLGIALFAGLATDLVPVLSAPDPATAAAALPTTALAYAPRALAVWVPVAALYAVLFVALEGATPGKMMLGLRVEATDGRPLPLGRVVGREVLGGLLAAGTAGLAHLPVALGRGGRGLHDRLAGARVVRVPTAAGVA
jgi:uncharacterized RDD family membrane protein YckC